MAVVAHTMFAPFPFFPPICTNKNAFFKADGQDLETVGPDEETEVG